MVGMLIAEDLLLLLYDDESGKPGADGTRLDNALAGALLVELSLRGQVEVADGSGAVKNGRLVVVDPATTDDPVLDEALSVLAEKDGKTPKQLLGPLKKGLRQRLLDQLAARGIVEARAGKVLGLFPTTRWPAVDSAHEAQVRERLRSVLVVGLDPDPHTAALTSLLHAVDALHKVVPSDDRRALKRRAKEISEGAWAAEAVRKAVEEVNAAVVVAVVAASTAAAGSSG